MIVPLINTFKLIGEMRNIISSFIIQFLLKIERFQEDVLNKRFEIIRKIYNSLVTITQNIYKKITKTKKYNPPFSRLSEDKNGNKLIFKQIQQMRKYFGLSEYSFYYNVKGILKLHNLGVKQVKDQNNLSFITI